MGHDVKLILMSSLQRDCKVISHNLATCRKIQVEQNAKEGNQRGRSRSWLRRDWLQNQRGGSCPPSAPPNGDNNTIILLCAVVVVLDSGMKLSLPILSSPAVWRPFAVPRHNCHSDDSRKTSRIVIFSTIETIQPHAYIFAMADLVSERQREEKLEGNPC
ncbi:hypothetical protein Ancab_009645 [Ancistrocladus abbreviatus]